MLRSIWRKLSRHLLWALLVTGSAACFCNPDPGPTPDSCDEPFGGRLDALEVGSISSENAQSTDAFFPQANGESLFIVRGGQGADMIGLRFGTQGGGDPACVAFDVDVKQGGRSIATREVSLTTYPAAKGRVTSTLWLPGNYSPGALEVSVRAGELTRVVSLQAVSEFDCATAEACPCTIALHCQPWQAPQDCETGLSERARAQLDAANACAAQYCPGSAGSDAGTADGGSDGGAEEACDETCRRCRANVFDTFSCAGSSQPNCGACATEAAACSLSPP